MEQTLPHLTMQTGETSLKRLLAVALAGVVVVGLTFGAASKAMAGDGEDDDEPFETKILKSILGGDRPNIDYRERSPLVVPPSSTLPPPETTGAVPNPAWPKDADIQQAKMKTRVDPRDLDPRTRYDPGRPLNPDELAGKQAGAGGVGAPSSQENATHGRALRPNELGSKGNIWSSIFSSSKDGTETAPYPGEPPRVSLTDPPTGYMQPSPNYPYGLSATREAPKPFKVEDQAVGRQ